MHSVIDVVTLVDLFIVTSGHSCSIGLTTRHWHHHHYYYCF